MIVLRPAGAADAATLAAIHVAAWRETYRGLLPDAVIAERDLARRESQWTGQFQAAAPPRVMLAEQAGRPMGFASCGPQRDAGLREAGFTGEVLAIYVLRALQGQGAGRALMRGMAAGMLRDGLTAAALWVLRDNARAAGFYAALGGTVVATREDRMAGPPVAERAYGWHDLTALAGPHAALRKQ